MSGKRPDSSRPRGRSARARQRALPWAAAAFGILLAGASAYEVPQETRDRLKTYLPHAIANLERRESIHLFAVGDSITHGFFYTDNRYSALHSYLGHFATGLAKEFFFTGGVRDLDPEKGHPAKLDSSLGPEVTLDYEARNGADIFFGFAPLTTVAFDHNPDVVIVMAGINDSHHNVPFQHYAEAAGSFVGIIRSKEADPLLLGPTVTIEPDPRVNLGLARRYSGVLRDVAARHNALFVDSGQVQLRERFVPDRPEPGDTFLNAVRALEPTFDHGPDIEDLIHLNETGHQELGKGIAKAVLDGPDDPAVEVTGTLRFTGPGQYTFTGKLKNLTDKDLEGVLCPLALGYFASPVPPDKKGEPATPDLPVTLKPGKSTEITVRYQAGETSAAAASTGQAWLDDNRGIARVPFLFAAHRLAHFADADAPIVPFAVDWDLAAGFNQSGPLTVRATVTNHATDAMAGTYRATWNGKSVEGTLEPEPGAGQQLELTFPWPEAPVGRLKSPVVLTVAAGGHEQTFSQEVEVVQNFGLGARIPLLPRAGYVPEALPASLLEEGGPAVSMRAEADAHALYLMLDFQGHELVETPQSPAAIIDLQFDARYYDQRGTIGFADVVNIFVPAVDGPAKVGRIRLAAFGNGYDRKLDSENVRAALETRADGTRRLTVVIPRAYFYLHSWDLGNGNSSLGISANAALCTITPETPAGAYPKNLQFCLTAPGIARHDIRSLATLELTSEPTGRWCSRVY